MVAQPNKYSVSLAGLALVLTGLFDIIGEAKGSIPLVIAITVIALFFSRKEIVKTGLGNKWVWIPLLVIWLSSLAYLIWKQDIQGFAWGTWFVSMYLLGRNVGSKTLNIIVPFSLVTSVFLIVGRVLVLLTSNYGSQLWQVHHLAAFLVIMGMALAQRNKWLVWITGAIAITLSGSQEAIIILVVMVLVKLWQMRRQKLIILPISLIALVIASMVVSGYAQKAYPNLNSQRFATLDSVTNLRATPIEKLLKSQDWIWGAGYKWDISMTSLHNVPLKIASQFGILAGLAWLSAMFWGLFRSRYRFIFIILLWYGIIDHSLWTFLLPWSAMMLGIATQQEGCHEKIQAIKEQSALSQRHNENCFVWNKTKL